MNSDCYGAKVYALIFSSDLKEIMLKIKLTIICAFSSQGAFKGPILEHDTFSNLLNNGIRGALVPDDTTLKEKSRLRTIYLSYLLINQVQKIP